MPKYLFFYLGLFGNERQSVPLFGETEDEAKKLFLRTQAGVLEEDITKTEIVIEEPNKNKQRRNPLVVSVKKNLTDTEYSELIGHLERTGYTLTVACRPDLISSVKEEYRQWSGGRELDDEAIETFDDKYGREWFLRFDFREDVNYPFQIVEMGTTGRGNGREPQGLHSKGRVTVCYSEVAETLILAGLRAKNAA